MIAPSLRRIVSHWRAAAEDPKTLLPAFEREVTAFLAAATAEDLDWLLENVDKAPIKPMDEAGKEINRRLYRIESALRAAVLSQVKSRLQIAGYYLFRSLLQAYSLPRNLGAKIEAANRFFSRTKRPSVSRNTAELVEQYKKTREQLVGFLEAAKEAIAQGKNHEEGGTSVKAGPFTLLNTGGFPPEMMTTVKEIVEKAADLLQKKRLAKVCYGEIHVTRTLSKATTLAFYQLKTDELFVRANIRKSPDTLSTVLHELGHRMQHKFLSGKQREINAMYRTIEARGLKQLQQPTFDNLPSVGETVRAKGKTLYVIRVEPDTRAGFKVHLDTDPNATKTTYSATLAGYQALKDLNEGKPGSYAGFITAYARKGGADENFAEMFAFYCMDKLPADQVELLEPILF